MKSKHPNLVKIGALIRHVRECNGFSQDGFAGAAGLGRTYYGRVERGEQNISIQNLIRIAITLKVEVGEFIPSISTLRKTASRTN